MCGKSSLWGRPERRSACPPLFWLPVRRTVPSPAPLTGAARPRPCSSEEGFFRAELRFPEDFPNNPPEMAFLSEMWHPNIYPDGKVCISILHPPGVDRFNEMESADERWRPILGVEQVLISVISLFSDPNDESPANIDAAVRCAPSPRLHVLSRPFHARSLPPPHACSTEAMA